MLSPEQLSEKLKDLRNITFPFLENVKPSHLAGKSILVPGGAGSIGATFVKMLVSLGPAKIVVIDPDENALSHLIRDVRNTTFPEDLPEIITLSLNIGSALFEDWAFKHTEFDYVFSFAARKHVRAERDIWSVLSMFECNVLAHAQLFRLYPRARLFSVSTDKASAPANLMGASKRMMERILFSTGSTDRVRSARFANVLFSAGSLTEAFWHRFLKQQTFACPKGVKRFIMTKEEAARLCLMAGLSETPGIYFPDFDSNQHQVLLSELLLLMLESLNITHTSFYQEKEALQYSFHKKEQDPWPVLWSMNDTVGEKDEEQFFTATEMVASTQHPGLKYVSMVHSYTNEAQTEIFSNLQKWLHTPPKGGLSEFKEWVNFWVPEYQLSEGSRSLDQKL